MGLNKPDWRSGQKVPDWKEVTPNHHGVRSEKVIDPRMEEILLHLQSRLDGGYVGLYLY